MVINYIGNEESVHRTALSPYTIAGSGFYHRNSNRQQLAVLYSKAGQTAGILTVQIALTHASMK